MDITIFHNPKCSKSRQTLKLLQERGLNPRIIHYLDSPPDHAEIDSILALLGLKPRALMRRREPPYVANHLDDPNLTDEQLIAAMIRHPILMERPIVLANGKARIGRPPEAVLEIL